MKRSEMTKYIPRISFTYEPDRHQWDDHSQGLEHFHFAFSTFSADHATDYSRWFTFVFGEKQIDINLYWYK